MKIKKRIDKKKKKTVVDYILLIVFILLLIFVICLLIKMVSVKKEHKQMEKADFTMPIVENKLNTVQLKIKDKKKGETIDYIFYITNYTGTKVNKKDCKYKFMVTSDVDASYKLMNKDGKNILGKNDISKYIKLEGKKEKNIQYHLKVKLNKEQKEEKVIWLYIEGKK